MCSPKSRPSVRQTLSWHTLRPLILASTRWASQPGDKTQSCSKLQTTTSLSPRSGKLWWVTAPSISTSHRSKTSLPWSALFRPNMMTCSQVLPWNPLCSHAKTWSTGPVHPRTPTCRPRTHLLRAWWTAPSTKACSTNMAPTTAPSRAESVTLEVSSIENESKY